MQSSESVYGQQEVIETPEESIAHGVKFLAEALAKAKAAVMNGQAYKHIIMDWIIFSLLRTWRKHDRVSRRIFKSPFTVARE